MQREIERTRLRLDAERALQVPDDLVEFCRSWLGYEPFEYMWPFLRDPSHFTSNVQARQTLQDLGTPSTRTDRILALDLASRPITLVKPKRNDKFKP